MKKQEKGGCKMKSRREFLKISGGILGYIPPMKLCRRKIKKAAKENEKR